MPLRSRVLLDVWIEIAKYLSISDLLSLRSCCIWLKDLIENRAIWHDVLLDIAQITNLPRSWIRDSSLSGPEIRTKAMSIQRLENRLSRAKIDPINVHVKTIQPNPWFQASFLPGTGGRKFVCNSGGAMGLYEICEASTVLLASTPSYGPDITYLSEWFSVDPTRDPVVLFQVRDATPGYKCKIVIFEVRLSEPAFVLLSESLETNARMRLSSAGDLWVGSYTGPDGMQYMRIRTIYLDADGVLNQVLLRFPRAEKMASSTALVSRRKLVWFDQNRISLYEIPELHPMVSGSDSIPAVSVVPIWVQTLDIPRHPSLGRLHVLPKLSAAVWHHRRHAEFLTAFMAQHLILLNIPYSSKEDPHCHHFSTPHAAFNSIRVVDTRYSFYQCESIASMLHTAVLPHGSNLGGFRLGNIRKPQIGCLTLRCVQSEYAVDVVDFDIETGQLRVVTDLNALNQDVKDTMHISDELRDNHPGVIITIDLM